MSRKGPRQKTASCRPLAQSQVPVHFYEPPGDEHEELPVLLAGSAGCLWIELDQREFRERRKVNMRAREFKNFISEKEVAN